MKKTILYFIAAMTVLFFSACRDCEESVEDSVAAVWKNGVKQDLPFGDPLSERLDILTNSVFVSGNDVYVAGNDRGGKGTALLWKNGVAQVLPDGTEATSVYVYGSDVYVVGNVYVWKNGVIDYTISGGGGAESVFVSEGDVYISGGTKVWKNGEVIQTLESPVNSIFVSDHDVYVLTRHSVFKNGAVILNAPDNVSFSSIFISGNDVYVAGVESYSVQITHGTLTDTRFVVNAKLWKNGIDQNLTDDVRGGPVAIFVSGNDVYVATEYSVVKNGVVVQNVPENAYFTSIFVSGNDVYVSGFYYIMKRYCD